MGHTLLRGHADLDVTSNTAIFSGDYLAGAQAALGVMMALWHRRKTGRGQLVEMSQAENASGMLAQAYMDYALNGRVQERQGNRSVYGFAPSGVYPCSSPGPATESMDRWIAIEITCDQEWQALRGAMGDPEWARGEELDTAAGRRVRHDAIDRELAAWTAGFDDYDLFHRLQAAGVPAAPVLEGSRAPEDPHVQARGVYQRQRLYDDVGEFRFPTPFYHFPETPITVRQPPVAFGEHNEYVYKDVIGVSAGEYERLTAEGHIATDFDPSLP
jgi:crotonobetainyl-CoA:carnitine CoA-transferase CaiB-like acyl-CoA transferase